MSRRAGTLAVLVAGLVAVLAVAGIVVAGLWPQGTHRAPTAGPGTPAPTPTPAATPSPHARPARLPPGCAPAATRSFVPTDLSMAHVTRDATVLASVKNMFWKTSGGWNFASSFSGSRPKILASIEST